MRVLPLCLVSLVAAGCQSMAPPTTEPKAPPDAGTSPAAALEAVDEAEETLRRLILGDGDPPEPSPLGERSRDENDGTTTLATPSRGLEKDDGDRCVRACRALASLERAADRLCGLTDENDPRCRDARARLDAGRDLVERTCDACRDLGDR